MQDRVSFDLIDLFFFSYSSKKSISLYYYSFLILSYSIKLCFSIAKSSNVFLLLLNSLAGICCSGRRLTQSESLLILKSLSFSDVQLSERMLIFDIKYLGDFFPVLIILILEVALRGYSDRPLPF